MKKYKNGILYEGDCLKIMPTLPAGSVDMILCDLPYGTTACKWDTIIPFEPLWREYRRLIKPKGAIVLTASQPFTSALVMSNVKEFRHEWIWDKVIPRGHLVAKKRPMQRSESVLVFSQQPPAYYPIMEKRAKPIKGKEGARTSIMGGESKGFSAVYTHKYPVNILVFKPDVRGKLHPTKKPVALFEYLIKTYTQPGETVLDNCAGSGTTGAACVNTDRKFILIEKEPTYCAAIDRRLKAAQ